MKIKDAQVKQILAEVEAEIGSLLKSETDRLAKGHDESAPEASASPGEGSEGSPSAPPAEGSESGPPPDASGAPPDASAPPADGAPPEAPGAPVDPAADQGPADPEALMAEYAKLPPEELKVHFMACKAALAQVMGVDPEAGASPEAPPAGPSAPPVAPSPSPAGPPPGGPLMQAEVPADLKNLPANGGSQKAAVPDAIKSESAPEVGTSLSKAEDKVKELEAAVADQDKQIELLVKAVDLVIGQPIRKAVTSVSFVPRADESKAEPSKAEISAKLCEVIRSKKLSKSESERAISYSMGNIGYEQIKDLLEKK